MKISKAQYNFLSFKGSCVNGQGTSNLIKSRKESSELSGDAGIGFEVSGHDAELSLKILEFGLRKGEVLSEKTVSLKSLVSNSLGFFDFKIGLLDHVGHAESLFKDGIDNQIVIVSPGLAEAEELVVLGLLVGSKLRGKICVELCSSECFTEEDKLKIFVEVELDAGISFFDSSDFSNEFFDEK